MVQSLLQKARAERRMILFSIGIWTTKDGKEIHVSNITDQHLENIYYYLSKRARAKLYEQIASAYALPEPRGEMAQADFWRGVDEVEDMTELDILKQHPFFRHLVQELVKRK
jgi:hypothetical protein